MILIDAVELIIDGSVLGILSDNNSDGVYDMFNDDTDAISYDETDGTYLLDTNGDGIWDYTYDPLTAMTSIYTIDDEIDDEESDMNIFLIAGIVIVVLMIIIVAVIIMRLKKK